MIGDTYFGEFYTRIRKRQGRLDGLQKYGRAYSFDRIRPLIEDGEYNRRHVAPYSLFVQLIYEDNRFELRLYPIYTNNLKTFWQPKFVDRKQFEHCTYILKSFQSTQLTKKQDEQERYYYVLDL